MTKNRYKHFFNLEGEEIHESGLRSQSESDFPHASIVFYDHIFNSGELDISFSARHLYFDVFIIPCFVI